MNLALGAGIDVMKVTVNWGARNARRTYVVDADSLEKVLSLLQARDEWGQFEGSVGFKFRSGAQNVVTSAVLSPTSSILLPKWPKYKRQPQACQDEWDTMWRALQRHEKGHAKLFESSFRQLVAYLENQSSMTPSDFSSYMDDHEKRVQKQSDDFDVQTERGRARGVELRITPACRSQR